MIIPPWLPLISFPLYASAKSLHSLPDDIFAFPKFKVSFLNGQPVLHETAHRWLRDGLRGGEAEFLNQPLPESPLKAIEGHDQTQPEIPPSDIDSHFPNNYTLELMQMGPSESYLCYLPAPMQDSPPPNNANNDSEQVHTPAHTLALLNPLWGTCLYHRHGWFTYSYCHGKEIRQFKERHNNPVSGNVHIEEDLDWHAYVLGTAPMEAHEPGVDLVIAERYASVGALEVAHNDATHYLVQHWGNGTLCDKTGKPREVEIQFHCSATTSDSILYVKETKTCSYTVVILTPRLCDEPGFLSRRDKTEEALIHCREVLQPGMPDQPVQLLKSGDIPMKKTKHQSVLPAPPIVPVESNKGLGSIAKIIEKMLQEKGTDAIVETVPDTDTLILSILGDGEDTQELLSGSQGQEVLHDRIADALRRAGIVVNGEKKSPGPQAEEKEEDQEFDELGRDEL